jgi:hypothetical protein
VYKLAASDTLASRTHVVCFALTPHQNQMNYEFPKDLVVKFLSELANYDFQRRVWLASSGPEISSFAEAICGLFDDTGLGDRLEKQTHPVFSAEIDESLRELDRLVLRASSSFGSMPPAEVIEHQNMREIRSLAAQILAQIEQEGIA